MLSDLSIKNYALIDSAQIHFEGGLNALTGETGAGKTIVMNALSLVLGERASSENIRTDQESATVEAVFELNAHKAGYQPLSNYLAESGLEVEDTLILKRVLSRSGKNRCFVNNSTTTLKTLNEIGQRLVDLHGQHDHQRLLDSKTYLGVLDAFAGIGEEKQALSDLYKEWRAAHDELQALTDQERERNRLLDQLRFQVKEIEKAELKEGEEDGMASERRRLRNFETLSQHTASILGSLEQAEGASFGLLAQVGKIQTLAEEMAERDPDTAPFRNLADNAAFAMEELERSVRAYAGQFDSDPGRLDTIESRLHLIQNLKKKYGNSIAEILSFLAESKKELDRLENYEEERGQLEKRFYKLTQTLGKAATDLSRKRRKVAKQLSAEITMEIRQLGMDARFECEVVLIDPEKMPNILRINFPQDDESPITAAGWDEVHFQLSSNPGEPLKTLKEVASGGEISRIMLAIKAVLARVDQVDLLVFDEIDSGIGGKTAHVVGGKMKVLAGERQVICITHLAPIASKADHHLRINKTSDGETTQVSITPLIEEERAAELTRMMGTEGAQAGIEVAEEMLQQAAV